VEAREEILARLRSALGPAPTAPPVPREYRADDDTDPAGRLDLFVDRLVDYKAAVTRCGPGEISAAVADALSAAGRLVTPVDVPGDWLSEYPGMVLPDDGLTVGDLDGVDAVLTGCAVAIAETGTIVLDAGRAQGRRALSLVPDHHVCVVTAEQVVGTVPAGLRRLTPTRPLTFISGPSATSDIELNRVEGVHGPRRLHVVLAGS
jgi:L-lactate dehydrogenase complex protein LldG